MLKKTIYKILIFIAASVILLSLFAPSSTRDNNNKSNNNQTNVFHPSPDADATVTSPSTDDEGSNEVGSDYIDPAPPPSGDVMLPSE